MKRVLLASLLLHVSLTDFAHSQVPKGGFSFPGAKGGIPRFKSKTRIAAGFAAAYALRRAGNAYSEYSNGVAKAEAAKAEARRVRAEVEKVQSDYDAKVAHFVKCSEENIERFEREKMYQINSIFEGINTGHSATSNDCIYSVFMNLNYNANSVYWSDTFSNPDVFFVVEVEGLGAFLLPSIWNEYKGGPLLEKVVSRELRSGTRVILRVLDDDSFGNAVWNSVMRSKVNFDVQIGSAFITTSNLLTCIASAQSSISLLNTPEKVVIDGPDQIAYVTFTVPDRTEKTWTADSELRDESNKVIGYVQFSQIWNRQAEIASLQGEVSALSDQYAKELEEFKAKIAPTVEERRPPQNASADHVETVVTQYPSLGSLLFWGTVGVVFLGIFFKYITAKEPEIRAKEPEKEQA